MKTEVLFSLFLIAVCGALGSRALPAQLEDVIAVTGRPERTTLCFPGVGTTSELFNFAVSILLTDRLTSLVCRHATIRPALRLFSQGLPRS